MTAEAKIRISTEGAQALTVLKRMRDEFAQIGKDGTKAIDAIEGEWRKAAGQIDAGLNQVSSLKRELATIGSGSIFGSTGAQASQLTQQLQGVRSAAAEVVATLAGAQAIREAVNLTDTYVSMTARMRVATTGQAEFNSAMAVGQRLTAQYGGALSANISSLTRTLSAIKPLNGTLRDAAVANEALLASLKISGATAEEASSAVLQFSQALGKGTLNGDEFNAVAESAPRLLQALSAGLGVSTSALKEMGAQGQLSTAKIIEGLRSALPELQREAAAVPQTTSQAFQAVKNDLLVYIGQSENARAANRLLSESLKGIGAAIGPILTTITALATVVGVTYVARMSAAAVASAGFAVQQTIVAAAARSAAAEMGMAAAASTGLTAALGGPVGLAVALATVAAAWIALDRAKNTASSESKSLDDLKRERDAVQVQIDLLNSRRRSGKVSSLDGADQASVLKGQLDGLTKQIEAFEQRKADALRMSGGPRGGSGNDQMLDPATIAAIEKEFKTRESVEKEFAAKRASYVLAKDAEINQARASGTMEHVKALETQKDDVLKRMEKDRQKALQELDKDGEVTRLAQAKDTFDKVAVLHADSLQRQAQQARQSYEDGLISYQTYLQARAAAEDQALGAEMQALRKQLSAQERAVAENRAIRAKANTANERASADDAIQRGLDAIAKLEADIEKKKRDQVTAAQQRRREEEQILIDLRRQREEIDAMLTKATGSETPDSIARSVRRQYEPQLQKVLQNNEDPGPLLKLIDVDVERAKFELLLRQFQERRDELNLAEQNVQAERDAGLITDAQAEERILELRKQSLQALRDQAAALDAQSKKLDEVAGKPQTKEAGQAKSAGIDVVKLSDVRNDLEKSARSTGMNAISTELSNILSGSKKATEGLRDMVSSFAKSMLDLIAKKLGEQLISSLFGNGGAPGTAGSTGWAQAAATFAASFFHGGGVVGTGGGTRALPASTWAFAPRYHTGGIAGLAPNEVPAILQAGEEVLTADDPRHSRNSSRSVGGVTVTNQVNISGAQGSEKDQTDAAGDLTTMINSAIDAWALRQARPGGILSGS